MAEFAYANKFPSRAVSDPSALDDGADPVTAAFTRRFTRLMNLLRRELSARMGEYGLTDAQWRPLWLLHTGQARSALELSRLLVVDAGATTRMLDRLEAKGLLARTRSAADRRVVEITVTDAGRAAIAPVPRLLGDLNQDLLAGLGPDDTAELFRLIDHLIANAAALQGARAGDGPDTP